MYSFNKNYEDYTSYIVNIAFTLRCWFSLASIALSYQLFNISNDNA